MTSKRFVSTQENLEITDALVAAFRALKMGDVLPNKQIDNLARGKRHLITKARSVVEREHGCILATVIGVGIKKREANNAGDLGREFRAKTGRGAKRTHGRIIGIIRQGTAEMDKRSVAEVTTEINRLGFIAEICSDD